MYEAEKPIDLQTYRPTDLLHCPLDSIAKLCYFHSSNISGGDCTSHNSRREKLMQKWLRTITATATITATVSACGGSIDSGTGTVSDPVYVCDANPAVEVDMLGAFEVTLSLGDVSHLTFLGITNHCDVIMKRLRFDLQGIDTNQFIVGSKGTPYFTDWHVMGPTGKTVMGPIDFPTMLAPKSFDSGIQSLSDDVPISISDKTQFGLIASFSQTEDSPGEFTTAPLRRYRLYWNDSIQPFELGDITYADGVSIPLDRITASTVLYTDIDIKPTP